MRLRRIPEAKTEILQSPLLVQDPTQYRGAWRKLLGLPPGAPLRLEVGMGRGKYITAAAQARPAEGFLGLELREEMIYFALRRLQGWQPSNLRFLWQDAALLAEFFAPGEISEILLPFSDPWPKARHSKRRLTSPRFLPLYAHILAATGSLCFKTDNMDFFYWSREQVRAAGFAILAESHDLPPRADALGSEYEQRFRSLGQPIYALRLAKPATFSDLE